MSRSDRMLIVGACALALAGFLLNRPLDPTAPGTAEMFGYGLLGIGSVLIVSGLVTKRLRGN
jgi:hypothetical protein